MTLKLATFALTIATAMSAISLSVTHADAQGRGGKGGGKHFGASAGGGGKSLGAQRIGRAPTPAGVQGKPARNVRDHRGGRGSQGGVSVSGGPTRVQPAPNCHGFGWDRQRCPGGRGFGGIQVRDHRRR